MVLPPISLNKYRLVTFYQGECARNNANLGAGGPMVGLGTPSTAFSHPSGPTIICMNNMDPFTNIKGIAGGADPYLSPSLISLSLRRRNYKAVRTGTFFIQGLMTIPTCTTQYLGFSGVGEGGRGEGVTLI